MKEAAQREKAKNRRNKQRQWILLPFRLFVAQRML